MNMVKNNTLPMRIIASAGAGNTPLEITAVKKGTTAYIGIKGGIYRWNKASSYDVETVVKGFKDDGATNAEVYVNTPGGDVFECAEILNVIDDNFKPENVKVRVGAVAASAGTRFLTKYHSTAKRNSQFMIHKPMGNPSGNEDEIEAGLKLIKNITQDYKTGYAKKMGITEAEVEKLWAKGDYWMTAKEALKLKLIDAIEDEDEKIDASVRMQLVACGAPNIPKIENNQNQNKHMELSVLAVQLGLPSTATQAEVDAKLKELQTKASTADGLVQAAADQKEAQKKAQKKTLLDAAEKDKKISAKQRPHLETLEVEALTAVLEGMKPITAISEGIDPKGTGTDEKGRESWTYADYLEKAPEAFEKLEDSVQKSLIDAHYKE
jgi:ATP-dependent protease ClpP protease subunit